MLKTINPMLSTRAEEGGPCHPLTWTQRKSHRFGQGAHVGGAKIEQDPAELVLTFKTWALYSHLPRPVKISGGNRSIKHFPRWWQAKKYLERNSSEFLSDR